MSQEASKELPCVRNDVKLEYNEKRGRYLVAAQDISAGKICLKNLVFSQSLFDSKLISALLPIFLLGEVIATETPYASILLTEFYSTHCQFCYRRAIAPIPCCCCARVSPQKHTLFSPNQDYFTKFFSGQILLRRMQSRSLE